MDQREKLLKIVKGWQISLHPEYRGFRCAFCQKYIRKAFHHRLDFEGFKTPVHLCPDCQRKLGLKKGQYKIFTCDKCGNSHYKLYHIWKKEGGVMIEIHFCQKCFLNSAKIH